MSKTTLNHGFIEKTFTSMRFNGVMVDDSPSINQPLHVIYGGANLFTAGTTKKLGEIALRSIETNAPSAGDFATIFGLSDTIAEKAFEKVRTRLQVCPIEDLRIDFEDGFGIRPDAEEDEHAVRAAIETAKAMEANALPPFFGIRVKSFSAVTYKRALRTLDLYLTRLIDAAHGLPQNFVVTLPKVESLIETKLLADILNEFESIKGLENGLIKIEIMVETPQALLDDKGVCPLPSIIDAARGRCRGAHFGAYDYMASLGIASTSQELTHQSCDNARNIMQLALSRKDIWLSDGATNTMPVGPHRGNELSTEQITANRDAVSSGWIKHFNNCKQSLHNGFPQGWDLHPAQIPARLAAVYQYYLENLDESAKRLKNFVKQATHASLVGTAFDDAATGQGLLNYFNGALNSGAIDENELLSLTGLTSDAVRSRSFNAILDMKRS